MHGAEHRPAVVLQPDQRPPYRQAGDEGAGTVDRIEHPDVLRIGPLPAVFLAEDAVLRITFGEQLPHRRLRRPIGDGDRIEGAFAELVLDIEALAEPRQDRPPRNVGHVVEEGDEFVGGMGGGHDGLIGWLKRHQPCARAPGDASARSPLSPRLRRSATLDRAPPRRAGTPAARGKSPPRIGDLTFVQRNIIFAASR